MSKKENLNTSKSTDTGSSGPLKLDLARLLSPTSVAEFLSKKWPDEFQVSHGKMDRLQELTAIPELLDLDRLTLAYRKPITLWYPPSKDPRLSKRIHDRKVSSETALGFYEAGATLYFTDVEVFVPETRCILRQLERDLGLPPGCARLELFASRDRSGTPLHFDHELNFNVQLAGRKKWTVAKNTRVPYPLTHYKPIEGSPRGEARRYIPDGLPSETSESTETFETEPGSVVFIPQGYWHSTVAQGDSIAIAVVIVPPAWLDLVLLAIRKRLIPQAGWRQRAVSSFGAKPRLAELAAMLERLPKTVSEITGAEVLSMLLREDDARFELQAARGKGRLERKTDETGTSACVGCNKSLSD